MAGPVLYEKELLLERVAGGDEQAFRQLFDTYRARLYQYIARFTKSETVAEELVMDVFMKLWLGRDLLPQVDNFDGFLFRVARNKAIDFLRSAARDASFATALWEQIQAEGDSADMLVARKEFEQKLREAIGLLPTKQQRVYRMSREAELSHDEIAKELNISRSTVNNQISDAQKFIRAYLAQHLDLAIVIALLSRV